MAMNNEKVDIKNINWFFFNKSLYEMNKFEDMLLISVYKKGFVALWLN